MKVVIVEDEFVAAQNLERLLKSANESITVITVLQSVSESVEWFSHNPHPEVVFMDIHLADGDSFVIFEKTDINCPIIFTTAYDEYALKAFEVNSVDYLLKPISLKGVKRALDKLSHVSFPNDNTQKVTRVVGSIREAKSPYKTHFLIPHKDKLIPIKTDDIAFIYSEFKMAKITCFNGQTYSMDVSLDELMRQLNPAHFFRANRQYIVSHRSIKDLVIWFGGKLSVNLSVATPDRIIVSRARSGELKKWFVENEQ